MFDAFESTVGSRIRYYRLKAGITQKALAEACGITEPAIRNYELGNRIPGFDTLNDISAALNISYYTLADPDLSALAGVMHTFFRLEYAHGLTPAVDESGNAVLVIDPNAQGSSDSFLQQMLNQWLDAKTKLDSGEWSPEQYEDWKARYPIVLQEDTADHAETEKKQDSSASKAKQKRPRKPLKK